jgi:hypothetical protein
LTSAIDAFDVRVASTQKSRIDFGNILNSSNATRYYQQMLDGASYVFADRVSDRISKSTLFGTEGPSGVVCAVDDRGPFAGSTPCSCAIGKTTFESLLSSYTSRVTEDCREIN